jgi:hypothetical protein
MQLKYSFSALALIAAARQAQAFVVTDSVTYNSGSVTVNPLNF